MFRQHVDGIIKANSAAKVIPYAEAIAEEVLRQHQARHLQWNDTYMIRENWKDHSNRVDMVNSVGLAFTSDEERGRVIYYPVCTDFGGFRARNNNMKGERRLCDVKKSTYKHLQSRQHLDALGEREKESRRNVRRTRIGFNIARKVLQTLREGTNYVRFESKLRDLHLVGLDIVSLTHSREFMRKFVGSMSATMDKRIGSHVKGTYPVTRRKRVIAFMVDKIT